MNDELKIKMYSFTLDCIDPYALAQFYADLLNWQIVFHEEKFACIGAPECYQGAYPGITFQKNIDYQAPIWPEELGAQQQMAHLDFAVNDLDKAIQYAIKCGATIAKQQFSDQWKVMLDPAGHPFCLCSMKPLFESEHFSLL